MNIRWAGATLSAALVLGGWGARDVGVGAPVATTVRPVPSHPTVVRSPEEGSAPLVSPPLPVTKTGLVAEVDRVLTQRDRELHGLRAELDAAERCRARP